MLKRLRSAGGLLYKSPVQELVRNAHVRVKFDPQTGLVRMVRTSTPIDTNEQLFESHVPIVTALDLIGREGKTLLIDTRLAPPRNDPEFEAALRPLRVRIARGFLRVAVVTRTATGQLQVQRQTRESGDDIRVFMSEEDAIAYLKGRLDSRRPPPSR
ncbi:MAG: hypothetical protein IPK82_01985 [Polyangiaceae bacterium]|nr:hypothetical protein [Polyangiaceae bacterium]